MGDKSSDPQQHKHLSPPTVPPELAKLIPDEKKRSEVTSLFAKFSAKFSGPLPAPSDLKEYDNIVPGLAERIVQMAENQSAHRIKLESDVVRDQLSESKRGQWLGFILAVICLGITVWMALEGHDVIAATVGGGTIVSLTTIFVLGRKQQAKDLKRKSG